MKRKIADLLLIVSIFLISFLTFQLIFKGIETSHFYKEVIAALMGTLLTVVITSFLLRQQAKSEEVREQNVAIFKEKCEAYKSAISALVEVTENQSIDPEDAKRIRSVLYNLSLFSSLNSMAVVGDFLRQAMVGDVGKKIGILEVASELRKDLDLPDFGNKDLDFDSSNLIEIENLIAEEFELLPSLKNIKEFLEELCDNLKDELAPLSLEEITQCGVGSILHNLNSEISFGVYADKNDYNISIMYPEEVNWKKKSLLLGTQLYDESSYEAIHPVDKLTVHMMIVKDKRKKIPKNMSNVMKGLNVSISPPSADYPEEIGYKNYDIEYDIETTNKSIKINSNPLDLATQLATDITAMETLVIRPGRSENR